MDHRLASFRVELRFAATGRLALLTAGLAAGLTFAPVANAVSGDMSAVQLSTPYAAPVPQAPKTSCDSNYSGACVPVARDVDCAGGSGNGPAYVSGPVTVVGDDIYGLDRDGDGTACDS